MREWRLWLWCESPLAAEVSSSLSTNRRQTELNGRQNKHLSGKSYNFNILPKVGTMVLWKYSKGIQNQNVSHILNVSTSWILLPSFLPFKHQTSATRAESSASCYFMVQQRVGKQDRSAAQILWHEDTRYHIKLATWWNHASFLIIAHLCYNSASPTKKPDSVVRGLRCGTFSQK